MVEGSYQIYRVSEGVSLKSLFPRLYSLETAKNCLVVERLSGVGEEQVVLWSWRRSLFVWEEKLVVDLLQILDRYTLNWEVSDCWHWTNSQDNRYLTKVGYEQIVKSKEEDQVLQKEWTKLVWLKWVPQKLNSFVWRVIVDRIATLPNLKTQGALYTYAETSYRMCEDKAEETPIHLFSKCRFATSVWFKVQVWLGFKMVFAEDMENLLLNFASAIPHKGKEIWLTTWHGLIWFIWKARDEVIFKGTISTPSEIFELIKINMWYWMKSRNKLFSTSVLMDWELCPGEAILPD